MILRGVPYCDGCGHPAAFHTGVSGNDYSNPKLSCRFETDRYEVCSCDKLKMKRDEMLEWIVQVEEKRI